MEHTLSCCLKALQEERNCWCHDQVLRAIADAEGSFTASNDLHRDKLMLLSER